jgi:hypothetical protein
MASFCRVEKSYDAAFFQLLARAGVRVLCFGVEATEDRLLDLINKGNTVKDIVNTIRYARAAKIHIAFNVIPDYPTITWDEVLRSVEFVRENIDFIDALNPQLFELSDHSAIAQELNAHGLAVAGDETEQSNRGLHTRGFTRIRGLSPLQEQKTREIYTHLVSDVAIYHKTRDLVSRVERAGFSWRKAVFVLADDIEHLQVPFDPSEPIEDASGPRFHRLDDPVLVVSSLSTHRRLSSPAVLLAILETADALGAFTIDDVMTYMQDEWEVSDPQLCRRLLQVCLRALLVNGMIDDVLHPWLPHSILARPASDYLGM